MYNFLLSSKSSTKTVAVAFDAMQETSAFPLFGSVSKGSLLALGVCLPMGYFVGAFTRGSEAQQQEARYEKLLDDSQEIIEEQQEEMESMEAENEEKEAEEQANAEKLNNLENIRIPETFFYSKVNSLSSEAIQKLEKIKPSTLSQASRISGVSPNDISVLMVYMGR